MISIIIADDHPIFIDGVKTALAGATDIRIVDEAQDGLKLLQLLDKKTVDLVLLDINMPGMDGLQAAMDIKTKSPDIKIIMLTQYDDIGFIKRCKALGVEGYLLKDCDKQLLINAIHLVYKGGTMYGTKCGNNNGFTVPDFSRKELITDNEKQLLKLMADEKCNKDIAALLNISINTTKKRRDRLMAKAGVKNTAGLIYWAMKNNLLT